MSDVHVWVHRTHVEVKRTTFRNLFSPTVGSGDQTLVVSLVQQLLLPAELSLWPQKGQVSKMENTKSKEMAWRLGALTMESGTLTFGSEHSSNKPSRPVTPDPRRAEPGRWLECDSFRPSWRKHETPGSGRNLASKNRLRMIKDTQPIFQLPCAHAPAHMAHNRYISKNENTFFGGEGFI